MVEHKAGGTVCGQGQPGEDPSWLVTDFVGRVPHVAHAVITSSDGMLMAVSEEFPRDRAEQLAVVAAGLSSLTRGAAVVLDGGLMVQAVVEMDAGLMVLTTVGPAASLAVLAAPEADLAVIAYEMTLLVKRAATVLA